MREVYLCRHFHITRKRMKTTQWQGRRRLNTLFPLPFDVVEVQEPLPTCVGRLYGHRRQHMTTPAHIHFKVFSISCHKSECACSCSCLHSYFIPIKEHILTQVFLEESPTKRQQIDLCLELCNIAPCTYFTTHTHTHTGRNYSGRDPMQFNQMFVMNLIQLDRFLNWARKDKKRVG